MSEVTITICGNLTNPPELAFTPSGAARASFTVASTPRVYDKQTGEWKDGEALFMRCTAWRELAENVAESFPDKGRVIVTGRLKSRSFETREGEKRTVIELDADEVGASIKFATVTVTKISRAGQQSKPGRQQSKPADDPWGAAPARSTDDGEAPF